ncbi:centromere protein J [Anopheles nili]|uniref:centromere protein J n=1 Tax=Anopheles nili TaxID=185578 RepID=UPI00237B5D2B|nr:centromere protein J [Anopheles nili]
MADSPRSILARLEQLKQWQEEQKRVLLDKHLAQQQILEREQLKMYEVLGLRQSAANEKDGEEFSDDSVSEPEYEETNLEAQIVAERSWQAPDSKLKTMFNSDAEKPTIEQEEALLKTKNIPKKRFLKRGEGLRARFKVDPNKFKLDNLPKYKYATHNRERSNRKSDANRESLPKNDGSNKTIAAEKNPRVAAIKPDNVESKRKSMGKEIRRKSVEGIVLDVNRVNDKKLETKRQAGGSLPSGDSISNADSVEKIVDLFAGKVKCLNISETETILQNKSTIPDAPWKQRLNPTISLNTSKEQRELNFFELLEQKVVGKSFNSNSSSILRFIAANESTINEEIISKDDTAYERLECGPLVHQQEITSRDRLAPSPSQLPLSSSDSDASDGENDKDGQTHVHFADEKSNKSSNDSNDTDHVSYNHLDEMTSSKMSTPNDKFIHRSQSLERTGESDESEENQSTHCMDDDATVDSANGQSEDEYERQETNAVPESLVDDTLRSEILAKSELLKERLSELEREIDSYRRENAELIQAKQDHELDRLKLQQDREEMEERINDERIKMEVYFHDERMKIESERKQALREAQKPNKKDKEEILRLKDELDELRKQQKEREAKHSASLARFRAQVKTMEKDLQEVRLELEVAKKDNRRLETENSRLKRQNNSRMLVEINRNIAKLAAVGPETERQEPKKDGKAEKLPRKAQKQQITTQERKTLSLVRAKVTSHPSARAKGTSRATIIPMQEEDVTSETDENEENIPYSENDTSDEEDEDINSEEALGANSSSMNECEPSSYFSKKTPTVRKTLFDAVNLNDASMPRQGLVRKENPPTKCDLLDRTPEAAEMIKSMKREIVNADGSRDVWYPNGNLKKISSDGLIIRMLYFNKDIKETNMTEGTTKYYYFETNTWHTTYLDGLEILEFPDGQTEHRFKDGSTEVHFPNGSIRTTNPNSADIAEEWKYPDGTAVIIRKNDDKEINLPNGQLEIHTQAHKRRIYPDGTVKFVYPDGSQESRYSNGRIRLKDKDGRLISDTGGGSGKPQL